MLNIGCFQGRAIYIVFEAHQKGCQLTARRTKLTAAVKLSLTDLKRINQAINILEEACMMGKI